MLGEGEKGPTKGYWYPPAPYGSWTREDLYVVFEADLLRWKIIRRNVCTAVPIPSAVGIELISGIRSEQF